MEFSLDSVKKGFQAFVEGLPTWGWKQVAVLNKLLGGMPDPVFEKELLEAENKLRQIETQYQLDQDIVARFTRDLLQNITINALPLGISVITRVPMAGLGTMALINILDNYPEYRRRYNEDFVKTWGNLLIDTAIEAGTEKIPLENLIKLAGTGGWRDFVKYMASEVFQENSAEMLHIAHEAAQGIHHSFDQVLERLAYTTALTSVSSPVLGGLGYTVGRVYKNRDPVSVEPESFEPVYVDKELPGFNYRLTIGEDGTPVFNSQKFYDYIRTQGEEKVLPDQKMKHLVKLLDPNERKTEAEQLLYSELEQELNEDLEKLFQIGKDFKKWYDKGRSWLEEHSKDFKYLDSDQLTAIYSLTSQGKSITTNTSHAEKIAREIEDYIRKADGDIETGVDLWYEEKTKEMGQKGTAFYRKIAEVVKDPYNILNYGLKVSSFYNALRGKEDETVIDKWMWRILGYDPDEIKTGMGAGAIELAKKFFEKKAKEKGLSPREYQGILWIGVKSVWEDSDKLDYEYSSHVVKNHFGFKIDTTLEKDELFEEITKLMEKHDIRNDFSAVFVEKHPTTGEYYVFMKPNITKIDNKKISKFIDDLTLKFNVIGVSQHLGSNTAKEVHHARLSKKANMFYVYNLDSKAPIDKITDELRRYDLRVVPTPAGNLLITTKKKNIDRNVVETILRKYLPEGFKIYNWIQKTDGNFLRYDIDPYIGQWDPEYWEEVKQFLDDQNVLVFKPFEVEGVKSKIFENMPLQFTVGGGLKEFPDYINQQDLIVTAYNEGRFNKTILPNNATLSDLIAAMLSAEEIIMPLETVEKALKLGYIDKTEVKEKTDKYAIIKPEEIEDFDIALKLYAHRITPKEFKEKFEVINILEEEERLNELLENYNSIAHEFGFASVSIPEPSWFWDSGKIMVMKPEVIRKKLEEFSKNLGIPKTAVGLGGSINLALFSGNSNLIVNQSAAIQGVVAEKVDITENLNEPPMVQLVQFNKGRGSFAHEWFHSLDSYFLSPVLDLAGITRAVSEHLDNIETGEVKSADEMFYTGKIRPEIKDVYKALLDYVYQPKFTEKIKNAIDNSPELLDYYLRETEMLARAFEYWYYNKFKGGDIFLADPIQFESENELYPWDWKELDKYFSKLFKILKTQEKIFDPSVATIPVFDGVRYIQQLEPGNRLITFFYKPKEHKTVINASINLDFDNLKRVTKEIDEFRKAFGIRVKVETANENKLPDLSKWVEALTFFEKKTGIPIKYLAPVITFTDKNPNWYGQTHELEIKIADGSPFIHELLHFLFNKGDVYSKDADFTIESGYNTANSELLNKFKESSYFKRLYNFEFAGRSFPIEEALAYSFEDWFSKKYGEHPLIVNREEIPEKFKMLENEYAELDKIFTEYIKRIKNVSEHEYNKTKGVVGYIQGAETIKKPNWSDKIYAWWIRSILSAPSTHLVNIISNFANLHAAALTKGIEEGKLKAALEFEKVIWQNLFTLGKSLQDTMAFFAKLDEPSKLEGQSQYYQFNNILDLPVKALQWEDAFFKSLVYNGFLAAEADKHIEEGINPYDPENEKYLFKAWEKLKNVEDRRFLFVKHPPEKIQQEAIYWAREFTFTDENELAQRIIEFRDKVPGFRYIIPFIKTPSNIMKQTFEMSPVGIILGLINNNPHLTAKGLAGSIMLSMAALALTGCDDEDNVICGYLSKIEPFSTLAQMVTDPDKALEKFNDVVFFNQAIQNLYYLFVKGDVLKPLKNIAGGFVPNFLYRLALIEDPMMRIKQDPAEAIINKIPLARKYLKPYYNLIGNQVGVKNPTPLSILLTPRLNYDIYGDPELKKVFEDLGIKVYPQKLFTTDEIIIARKYGEYLRRLVRDERFKKMIKSQQKAIILSLIKNRNKTIRRIRERWKVYTGK